MYVPPHFAETDPEVLRALIRAHPLGTWVVPADGTLVVNHIPFLVRGDMLVGHVARANDVWKKLGEESVVVFQGAESYISPSWYATKQEHGKVVPTWNYAVVHAHGVPRAIEDRDWLYALVTALTDSQESNRPKPWRVTDAPPPVATAKGLGYGATAADAEELYPDHVERVPAEDPFPAFLEIDAEGGQITAYLDDDDTITNLEAGAACGE